MKAKDALRTLATDARQGIVGGSAFALVGVAVLALLGVIGGTVSAWTLGALAVILTVPAAIVISAQGRKLDQRAGELREAHRQAAESRKAETCYRQQLDLQARGRTALSPPAQAFTRRIMSLRNSVAEGGEFTSDLGKELLRGIVSEMRETIGSSPAFDTLAREADRLTLRSADAITELDQLEAIATEWGLAEVLSAPVETPN